jgi:hypothetical protein
VSSQSSVHFWLKGWAPSFDSFAYYDPAHTQSPDDKTVAQSSNAGALPEKDSAQPAQGKVAKEPLVDLGGQASPAPLAAGGLGDARKFSQRPESQTRRLVGKRSTPRR